MSKRRLIILFLIMTFYLPFYAKKSYYSYLQGDTLVIGNSLEGKTFEI